MHKTLQNGILLRLWLPNDKEDWDGVEGWKGNTWNEETIMALIVFIYIHTISSGPSSPGHVKWSEEFLKWIFEIGEICSAEGFRLS